MSEEFTGVAAGTAAVAPSATTEFEVAQGQTLRLSVSGTIAGAEEFEILENQGGVYVSVTDPSDPIDQTKKILTVALNNRVVTGKFSGAIRKSATAASAGIRVDS